MNISSFRDSFDKLSPQKKRLLVIGSVAGGVLVLIGLFVSGGDDQAAKRSRDPRPKSDISLLTGQDTRRLGFDQLQADNKRLEANLEAIRREMQALQINSKGGTSALQNGLPFGSNEVSPTLGITTDVNQPQVGPSGSAGVTPQLAPAAVVAGALKSEAPGAQATPAKPGSIRQAPTPQPPPVKTTQQSSVQKPPSNADVYSQLPTQPAPGDGSDQPSEPKEERIKLRTLRSSANDDRSGANGRSSSGGIQTSSNPSNLLDQKAGPEKYQEPEFILPAGSMISGTLLNGMDAPAGGRASGVNNTPTVLRIKHEAILPNGRLMDLRECLIVASGQANLSAGRVNIRAEQLSCQRSDGAVIDTMINAYASGSDGRSGVPGQINENTAKIARNSFIAGIASGLTQSLGTSRPNVALSSNGAVTYPSIDEVVKEGFAKGAGDVGKTVSEMYNNIAKDAGPTVMINAGIQVDFIMATTAVLKFKKSGEIRLGTGGGPVRQQGAQTQQNPSQSLNGIPNSQYDTPGYSTHSPSQQSGARR